MKFFAIRHKATGLFMPAQMFRTACRGWSTWEPGSTNGYGGYNKTPRLFETRIRALRSVIAWAAGPWTAPMEQDGDWESGYYQYQGTPCPKGKTTRSRDDLEIVEVEVLPT